MHAWGLVRARVHNRARDGVSVHSDIYMLASVIILECVDPISHLSALQCTSLTLSEFEIVAEFCSWGSSNLNALNIALLYDG